jgi:hypothetical protein
MSFAGSRQPKIGRSWLCILRLQADAHIGRKQPSRSANADNMVGTLIYF